MNDTSLKLDRIPRQSCNYAIFFLKMCSAFSPTLEDHSVSLARFLASYPACIMSSSNLKGGEYIHEVPLSVRRRNWKIWWRRRWSRFSPPARRSGSSAGSATATTTASTSGRRRPRRCRNSARTSTRYLGVVDNLPTRQ